MTTTCIICNNLNNHEPFIFHELQFGLGDPFKYQRCANCGSLQLLDPPNDFSKYYPNDHYYSFTEKPEQLKKPGYLRTAKTKHLLYGEKSLVGAILSVGYKIPDYYTWMMRTKVKLDDAILDVGSGGGMLLGKLHRMGFTSLTGIDPFINHEVTKGDIRILKKEIAELNGKFDLIMMHHSLEHMADPVAAMKNAHRLLNENRYLLVRIPVMGNYGWNKYGEHWAGIDAPRHHFIPSETGMRLLGERSGFELTHLEYDTVDYLIWCSEQYKMGIPLYAKESRMVNRKKNPFTAQQIFEYRKILAEANAGNYGDTAAFYFLKK